MGFSLERFFEELEYMVSHGVSHLEVLNYIEHMKQYAKDCNQL
jgi:hypothetical protein